MKELLRHARHEILDLRRRNELLSAQMAVVDVFAAACGLRREGGLMHPDIAYDLEKAIERMEADDASRLIQDEAPATDPR